jgi:hypothetical protein
MIKPTDQEIYEWIGLSPEQARELLRLYKLRRQAGSLHVRFKEEMRRARNIPDQRYERLEKAEARANRRHSRRRKAERQHMRVVNLAELWEAKLQQAAGASEQ